MSDDVSRQAGHRARVASAWELGAVGAEREDDGSYSVTVSVLATQEGEVTAGVDVRVRLDEHRQVLSVGLARPMGVVLDASTLQRFAWARWLTVADAAVRDLQAPETSPHPLTDYFGAGVDLEKLRRNAKRRQEAPRRPGRRGHSDDFYRAVSERYRHFRWSGSTSPTKDLADAYGVTRNTAAGWVKVAREKKLLPLAHRNRAG